MVHHLLDEFLAPDLIIGASLTDSDGPACSIPLDDGGGESTGSPLEDNPSLHEERSDEWKGASVGRVIRYVGRRYNDFRCRCRFAPALTFQLVLVSGERSSWDPVRPLAQHTADDSEMTPRIEEGFPNPEPAALTISDILSEGVESGTERITLNLFEERKGEE